MGANVLIMAGGTGGHVFPALACAREFQNRGYTVHWLGTPRGIENELVPTAGLPLHLINVTGLRGKSKLSLLKAPFVLLKAVWQARKIIRELKPVCVLGFGGYVTGPGGVAARLAGVPVIVHEQNAVAGTANRLLAPLAARVCEAFPKTFGASDKLRTTGNPVRPELFTLAPRAELEGRKARLLVLGGSLGAEPLNKLLPEALRNRISAQAQSAQASVILRLRFTGRQAQEPDLGALFSALGGQVRLLHGGVEHIQGHALGQLLLSVTSTSLGAEELRKRAGQWAQQVEVVGYGI